MNTIQKVFKKLSIFLVFAMVIGLMTPGVVLAKKKDYKVYVDYSDGLVIVYKGKKLFVITDSNVDRIYKNESCFQIPRPTCSDFPSLHYDVLYKAESRREYCR